MLIIDGLCYPDGEDIERGMTIHEFGDDPSDDVESAEILRRTSAWLKSYKGKLEKVETEELPF